MSVSPNKFRQVFENQKIVLPVIHVVSADQSISNALVAAEAGTDGIFLINHGISYQQLLEIHRQVKQQFPDWWIGINCLDLHPSEVFAHVPPQTAGVWTDNALIREDRQEQPEADAVLFVQKQYDWSGLYFGGVAFKYQRHVDDISSAAVIASAYMDVVTTSGPGTGMAAELEKIRQMKESLGEFPLAIASGITPENIKDYLPFTDCFLVATGISRDFYNLDPARLQALMKKVRDYSRENE